MARVLALIAAGVVANVVLGEAEDFPGAIDVTDMDPRPSSRWTYDGEAFAPPTEEAAADRRVTRLAFRNRFTQAELVALELASIDNPAGTAEQRQQAASLRVMLANLQAATFIDLDRADTRTGVLQLEQAGLLGAGRALAILDAPVQDVERPAG